MQPEGRHASQAAELGGQDLLLIAACGALVAVSLTALLLPAYLDLVSRVAIIPELGELWMMGWLLIKGIGEQPLAAAAI